MASGDEAIVIFSSALMLWIALVLINYTLHRIAVALERIAPKEEK